MTLNRLYILTVLDISVVLLAIVAHQETGDRRTPTLLSNISSITPSLVSLSRTLVS